MKKVLMITSIVALGFGMSGCVGTAASIVGSTVGGVVGSVAGAAVGAAF